MSFESLSLILQINIFLNVTRISFFLLYSLTFILNYHSFFFIHSSLKTLSVISYLPALVHHIDLLSLDLLHICVLLLKLVLDLFFLNLQPFYLAVKTL